MNGVLAPYTRVFYDHDSESIEELYGRFLVHDEERRSDREKEEKNVLDMEAISEREKQEQHVLDMEALCRDDQSEQARTPSKRKRSYEQSSEGPLQKAAQLESDLSMLDASSSNSDQENSSPIDAKME